MFSKDFVYRDHLNELKQELLTEKLYRPAAKDILIVVKDQLFYVKACIESIQKYTKDYTLYIWDNGSKPETAEYLQSLQDVVLTRVEENEGFIIPNNSLAKTTKSEYIILLNSDTEVRPNWDTTLIAWMQQNLEIGAAGYQGGWLNAEGQGCRYGCGYDIDYVCGWSLCIPRRIYQKFGLFDEEHLYFAYGEDSDFSLRLREAGQKVYAMYADLVIHYENKTISQLRKDGLDIKTSFESNHNYIRKRWERYLCRP